MYRLWTSRSTLSRIRRWLGIWLVVVFVLDIVAHAITEPGGPQGQQCAWPLSVVVHGSGHHHQHDNPCGVPGHGSGAGHHHHFAAALWSLLLVFLIVTLGAIEYVAILSALRDTRLSYSIRGPPSLQFFSPGIAELR